MQARLHVLAACAGNAAAYAVINTSPLLVGALRTSLGLDEAAAGALMTMALLLMGITALACAPLLRGIRQRQVALAAALVLAGGEGAAALLEDFARLPWLMAVIGLGAGGLLAAVNASIAAGPAPDRLFGHALMSAYAVAALLMLALGAAIENWSYRGAFAVLTVLTLAVAPLMWCLPLGTNEPPPAVTRAPGSSALRGGPTLLLGIFALGVPMMGFYAFMEGLGGHLALPPEFIATTLATQQLASVAGAWLAARASLHIGLGHSISAATVLHSAAIACAVLGGGPWSYALGVVGEGLTFLFLLPALFTVAARLDASGRWAAAANGALFLATGLAPGLIGAVISRFGYDTIAWLMLLATPAGLLAFRPSVRAAA